MNSADDNDLAASVQNLRIEDPDQSETIVALKKALAEKNEALIKTKKELDTVKASYSLGKDYKTKLKKSFHVDEPPKSCDVKEMGTFTIECRVTSNEEGMRVSYQWKYKKRSREEKDYPCTKECLSIPCCKIGDSANYFCRVKVTFPNGEEAERNSRHCELVVSADDKVAPSAVARKFKDQIDAKLGESPGLFFPAFKPWRCEDELTDVDEDDEEMVLPARKLLAWAENSSIGAESDMSAAVKLAFCEAFGQNLESLKASQSTSSTVDADAHAEKESRRRRTSTVTCDGAFTLLDDNAVIKFLLEMKVSDELRAKALYQVLRQFQATRDDLPPTWYGGKFTGRGGIFPGLVASLADVMLSFYGVVTITTASGDSLTEKLSCRKLAEVNVTSVRRVAHCLSQAKKVMKKIEEFYASPKFAEEQTGERKLAATLPVPITIDKGQITFVRLLDKKSLVFLAKMPDGNGSKIEVVVKFASDRYGVEPHRHCANKQLAPSLHHFMIYDDKLLMVVMEYCRDFLTIHEAKSKSWYNAERVKEKAAAAIRYLHSGDFVHGDVREFNLMTNEAGEVKLIDFDWAGKAGKVRFPSRLNHNINWPAEAYDAIHKVHDEEMLEKIAFGTL